MSQRELAQDRAPVSGSRDSASLAMAKIATSRVSSERMRSAVSTRASSSCALNGLEMKSSAPARRPATLLAHIVTRQQHHIYVTVRPVGADGAAEFETVHLRHLQIRDDQPARAIPQDVKCLAAIAGRNDFVSFRAERVRLTGDRDGLMELGMLLLGVLISKPRATRKRESRHHRAHSIDRFPRRLFRLSRPGFHTLSGKCGGNNEPAH